MADYMRPRRESATVMTAEVGGLVWSLDKDFQRMERLKFVSLNELPD